MNSSDVNVVSAASKEAQEMNGRRNMLIRAIDKRLGEEQFTLTSKTYVEKK